MTDISSMSGSLMEGLSKEGLDGYEVYVASSSGLTIEVKDGDIDVFVNSDDIGISLRVLKEQKLGVAFSTHLLPGDVPTLVQEVIHGASATDPDPFVGFPVPSAHPRPQLEQFDPYLHKTSVGDKIDMARDLEAAARSSDPRIKKVRKAAYVETTGTVMIRNHSGLDLSYDRTLVAGHIMVVAEDGGSAEIGWDYGFSPFLGQLEMDSIGKTAAERAVRMLGARPVKSMQTPAVLPPWVAADILSVLSASFLADNIQKGKSMLVGRMGEQVFSTHVTIVDDGLYPGGMGSSPFDDEGSVRQETVLVSEGVIRGFLYDYYTATKENRGSTGNAGRQDIKAPPSVRTTNFYIPNGSFAPDDLVSSLEEGFMVTDLIGLHTADPISGDFSVGAAGLWIKRGEAVFPVKGVAISGNIMDLFSKVDGIGTDLAFFGKTGAPSLRISNLHVAGSDS
jgi:PmbA protein